MYEIRSTQPVRARAVHIVGMRRRLSDAIRDARLAFCALSVPLEVHERNRPRSLRVRVDGSLNWVRIHNADTSAGAAPDVTQVGIAC